MKSKYLLSVLFIFLFSYSGFGQINLEKNISPAFKDSGISPQKVDALKQFIQESVDAGKVPGGVFLISRKGKTVLHEAFGARSPITKAPYKKDDIFRIASMTKAVTTVSILQLYEQGKLGLDEPIHHFIPSFKKAAVLENFNEADSSYTCVKSDRSVTIRQLLTHTSGITYGAFNPGKINAIYTKHGVAGTGLSHANWSTKKVAEELGKTPLVFQPGTRYLYGLNMEVLGAIIEVASGLPLNEYFRKNIFDPLGMNDTYFYLPSNKHERLVPIYTYSKDGKWTLMPENEHNYPTQTGRTHFAGGGGLSSTALDYAKFIMTLEQNHSGEGYRLLGRKTMEMMTSDQMIRLNKDGKGFSKIPGLTYGLGFSLITDDGGGISPKSPGTFEWGGYFNTKFYIDPAEDLIFVGMTQVLPFKYQEFWNRVSSMIYASIED